MTAREIQREDRQPSWTKAFDTFCLLDPWITTDLDRTKLDVRCEVNGTERQSAGRTRCCIRSPLCWRPSRRRSPWSRAMCS
nr:fumarylacetoacetate hydrolase family protein [Streptomyces sp. TRM49041]